jgi:hypothetical protein
MYVYTTYTRPLSVQAQYSRSCPIISNSCYNSSPFTWTVVSSYFLCRGSPCPILRTFAFSWFCMTSARCLHNFFPLGRDQQMTQLFYCCSDRFRRGVFCLRRRYLVTATYTCLLKISCLAANVFRCPPRGHQSATALLSIYLSLFLLLPLGA